MVARECADKLGYRTMEIGGKLWILVPVGDAEKYPQIQQCLDRDTGQVKLLAPDEVGVLAVDWVVLCGPRSLGSSETEPRS